MNGSNFLVWSCGMLAFMVLALIRVIHWSRDIYGLGLSWGVLGTDLELSARVSGWLREQKRKGSLSCLPSDGPEFCNLRSAMLFRSPTAQRTDSCCGELETWLPWHRWERARPKDAATCVGTVDCLALHIYPSHVGCVSGGWGLQCRVFCLM